MKSWWAVLICGLAYGLLCAVLNFHDWVYSRWDGSTYQTVLEEFYGIGILFGGPLGLIAFTLGYYVFLTRVPLALSMIVATILTVITENLLPKFFFDAYRWVVSISWFSGIFGPGIVGLLGACIVLSLVYRRMPSSVTPKTRIGWIGAFALCISALLLLVIVSGRVPAIGSESRDSTGLVPCCAAPEKDTSSPAGLIFDAQSHSIIFVDVSQNIVEKLAAGGSVSVLAGHCIRELVGGSCMPAISGGQGVAASFDSPQFIALDSKGEYYVWSHGDLSSTALQVVSRNGTVRTISLRDTDFTSMEYDPRDQRVYSVDGNLVERLNRDGTYAAIKLPHVSGKYHGLETQAEEIGFGPIGWPFLLDAGESIIVVDKYRHSSLLAGCGPKPKVDLYGNTFCESDHRDGTGARVEFSKINGFVYDPDDHAVYVADESTIRRVTRSGVVTTLIGICAIDDDGFNRCQTGFRDGAGRRALFGPLAGITYDSADHDLYVSDPLNHAIRSVTPSGGVSTVAVLAPASRTPPTKWSAEFAAPGGYIMRLWVDGNNEQERFYWHRILYTVRTGLRTADYGWNTPPFRIPFDFYRTGEGAESAPPYARPSSRFCSTRFTFHYDGDRINSGSNYFCRSIRIVSPSGINIYSDVEYMVIPHDPTVLVVGGK